MAPLSATAARIEITRTEIGWAPSRLRSHPAVYNPGGWSSVFTTRWSIAIGPAVEMTRAVATSSCQNGYWTARTLATAAVSAAQNAAATSVEESRAKWRDHRVGAEGQAPAQLRLRGLAPARPPEHGPLGLGRSRSRSRAAGRVDLRAPGRAPRPRHVLRAADDR